MTNPYSRLYHKIQQEFPKVYADDALFAWWVRLLMWADAAWPLRLPVPASVPPKVLERLRREGLIQVTPSGFTVLGLEAERRRRSDVGRSGAEARWGRRDADAKREQSGGNADSKAFAMPRRDETRENGAKAPTERTRRDSEPQSTTRERAAAPERLGDIIARASGNR